MAAGTARADTMARPARTSCTASVSRARVLSNSWLAATNRMARSLGSPPPLPVEISCAASHSSVSLQAILQASQDVLHSLSVQSARALKQLVGRHRQNGQVAGQPVKISCTPYNRPWTANTACMHMHEPCHKGVLYMWQRSIKGLSSTHIEGLKSEETPYLSSVVRACRQGQLRQASACKH